jgi:hypothetical protein
MNGSDIVEKLAEMQRRFPEEHRPSRSRVSRAAAP